MTYRVETTIPEVDVYLSGYCIGSLVDFDCTFVLDDNGDLIDVEVTGRRNFGTEQQLFFADDKSTGTLEREIWRAALEHHTHNRWDHIDRAGVPVHSRHEFADERLPQSAFI